jgi:hypothetical protein
MEFECYVSVESQQDAEKHGNSGDNTLLPEIHRRIPSIRNKEELPEQCKELLYLIIRRVIKVTVV